MSWESWGQAAPGPPQAGSTQAVLGGLAGTGSERGDGVAGLWFWIF